MACDSAKGGKRQLCFDGCHENLRQGQRKGPLSLKGRQKAGQIFTEAGGDDGCARSRVWRGRHGPSSTSQDVSTFLSSVTDLSLAPPCTNTRLTASTLPTASFPRHSPLSEASPTPQMAPDEHRHATMVNFGISDPLPPATVMTPTLMQSDSSTDSTFLEDDCQTGMAPPSGAVAVESGGRKVSENSVSSSTDTDPHPPPPLSQNTCPISSDGCCMEIQHYSLPDSSSYDLHDNHPLSFGPGESGTQTEGLPPSPRTQPCKKKHLRACGRSSSDRLVDMVAGMSMDGDVATTSTSNLRDDTTTCDESACHGASYFPDTCSTSNGPIQLTGPAHPASTAELLPAELEGVKEACDLQQQFKPSSFSTPVQSAVSSTRLSHVTQTNHTLPVAPHSPTANMIADSVTRLDFTLPHPVCSSEHICTVATPSRYQTTAFPSPPKSILKKYGSSHMQESWSEGTARCTSKCVTFNLHNLWEDDSSILARETPLELWTSLKLTSPPRLKALLQASTDEDCDSVLVRETPEEQWHSLNRSLTLTTGPGSSVLTNNAAQPRSTETTLSDCEVGCSRDEILARGTPLDQWPTINYAKQGKEKSAVAENAPTVLTNETYEDIWKSLNCSALILAEKDCDVTCGGQGDVALADETPSQLWQTLATSQNRSTAVQSPEIAKISSTTNNHISCEHYVREDTSMVYSLQLPVQHPGECETEEALSSHLVCHRDRRTSHAITGAGQNWTTQRNDSNMCILAMETPVHMWTSPTTKLVDNTFKHLR